MHTHHRHLVTSPNQSAISCDLDPDAISISELKTLGNICRKYRLGVRMFSPICFHPSNLLSRQTDWQPVRVCVRVFVCVWRVCPVTDPRLNCLSQGVNGLPASSCGRRATDRPVAFSPRVRPHERDIIVSVLAVLKSPRVDVEDSDRVVGAGAGQLEPGALLLNFTARVGLSVFLVAVPTCSTGPGPPAEPLDRQRVALSVGGRLMKGDNGSADLDSSTRGRREVHDGENYACQRD